MEREEKNHILLSLNKDGEITKSEITQEDVNRIFFSDGNREWDQIQRVLPTPVWERIVEDGVLLYEGYTVEHKAFGAGKVFYRNGRTHMEGIFGLKGFLSGKVYDENGVLRFDGVYRLNQAYGPNFPEYGSWFGEDGKRIGRGKITVSRGSVGFPLSSGLKDLYWPKGVFPKGHALMWEDVRKWAKKRKAHTREETIADLKRYLSNPDPYIRFLAQDALIQLGAWPPEPEDSSAEEKTD